MSLNGVYEKMVRTSYIVSWITPPPVLIFCFPVKGCDEYSSVRMMILFINKIRVMKFVSLADMMRHGIFLKTHVFHFVSSF